MKLILIRHGRTSANENRLYCGASDIPLSPAGEAELLELKRSVSYPAPDGCRVLTSGMLRCEQTLKILYGRLPHEAEPALREMDFGAFELRSYEQMKNEPDYAAWISGDNDANLTPGGESGNMMKARVLAALENLAAEGRDTLAVIHGGPIAAIMEHLFPSEQKNRYEWQPGAGLGYIVTLREHSSYVSIK